jgi:hypothetical protein
MMPTRDELIKVAGDALMDADCTSINDLSIEVADALLGRWPHIERMEHHIVETWQERPREFSYRCSCGFVHKHQRFGLILGCPDGRPDPTP